MSCPIGKYLKLSDWLSNWQKVVLPVPGVPVTIIFGVLCGMYPFYSYINCWKKSIKNYS